jgi:hypothetical protein
LAGLAGALGTCRNSLGVAGETLDFSPVPSDPS